MLSLNRTTAQFARRLHLVRRSVRLSRPSMATSDREFRLRKPFAARNVTKNLRGKLHGSDDEQKASTENKRKKIFVRKWKNNARERECLRAVFERDKKGLRRAAWRGAGDSGSTTKFREEERPIVHTIRSTTY